MREGDRREPRHRGADGSQRMAIRHWRSLRRKVATARTRKHAAVVALFLLAPTACTAPSHGASGIGAGIHEIRACGAPREVTPTSLAAAMADDGCANLALAPGDYGAIEVRDRSGGVLTLRCAEPGACTIGSESSISDSDGVIVDGARFQGGNIALTITGSSNVLVRRSSFIEQTATGVLVAPRPASDNIQITENEFRNGSRGCQRNNRDNCSGALRDGTPVASMDYGVRVYAASTIEISKNSFSSLFNHAISLKHSTGLATIVENRFDGCGRICIQLGQEPNTVPSGDRSVTSAVVARNTLQGDALQGILVQNIEKADITDNVIRISGRPIQVPDEYGKCSKGTGGCPLLGSGFPAERTVIRRDNTVN